MNRSGPFRAHGAARAPSAGGTSLISPAGFGAGGSRRRQALARLAETLGRVAAKAPDSLLETVYRAVLEPGYATSVMGIWGEPNPDPIKRRYWEAMAERSREKQAREREAWAREKAAREAAEGGG